LTDKLGASLSPVAIDLLEIASAIYVADQYYSRGGHKEFEYGTRFRRHFRFEIGVRCPEIWKQDKVHKSLVEILTFLTDDDYEFGFCLDKKPRPIQGYLCDQIEQQRDFEEVVLFSGGLDSLGGAVQEVINGQRPVALVSHRPAPKTYHRQKALHKGIELLCRRNEYKPLHVPIEINKGKRLGRDFNQRSRSFLFAAMAAGVARIGGLNKFRFYENGVTSLNLPVSEAVIGGRASRTTHPLTLDGLGKLLSALFETNFKVENPFQWKTKADVIELIKGAGAGRLCLMSCSCAHTWTQSRQHPHCGRCSQCLERRLTCLAARCQSDEDSSTSYESDVLIGPCNGADWSLTESYVRQIRSIETCTKPEELLELFPVLSRALNHLELSPTKALDEIFKLLKSHATQICDVLATEVARYAPHMIRLGLPKHCLLAIACGAGQPTNQSSELGTPPYNELLFDPTEFQVSFRGIVCRLGKSKEYAILEYLGQRSGKNISHSDLQSAVWNGIRERGTIHHAVYKLRRRLKQAGLGDIQIVSEVRDHYRLILPI